MKCNSLTLTTLSLKSFTLVAGLVLSACVLAAQTASPYTYATRYNKLGQVTGTISPDPGPNGPAGFPATRTTYTGGQPGAIETGYLKNWKDEGTAPASWGTDFVINTVQVITYDARDRKSTVALTDAPPPVVPDQPGRAGNYKSLTQYNYDELSRVKCKAERMNPAVYTAALPDACVLGTQGSYGADRITKYTYNNFDQVLTETRGLGTGATQQVYVTNTYDARGQLTDIKDANGNITHLEYYPGSDLQAQRLKRMCFPEKTAAPAPASTTDCEEYTYDNNGNRKTLRKRDGVNTITYTYDNLNRVTLKDIPGSTAADVTYNYTLTGLQLSAAFGSGKVLTNTYNGFGNLQTETTNVNGSGYTLGYLYDSNGNRTRVTHPDGQYFTYEYDVLGRLTYIRENGTVALIHNNYDVYARPKDQTTSGNAITSLDYDSASRIQTIGLQISGTAFDLSYGFTYGPTGQVATQTLSNGLYQYKESGSKTGSYSVNGLNQYTGVGGAAYGYDKNSNLTCDGGYVEASNACTATRYTYDVENRLTSASGNRSATLDYDPSGRLYQTTAAGLTTYFLYSGDALVAEYQNGAMTKRYVFGTGVDRPLVTYAGSSLASTNRQFLHVNHQGSVIAGTDSGGNGVFINTYDAYGVPSTTNQGRFAYTGQTWLPELGMYYYKARIYYPQIGRFLQTDPIGYKDNMNLYAYVGNDPLNKHDPTGNVGVLNWTANDAVTLEVPYTLDQSAASLTASASAIEARFAKDFSGTVNINGTNVKVTAQAIAVTGTKEANIVKVVPSTQGVTQSGRAETNTVGGNRITLGANTDGADTASHEFGHAAGAGDQYAGGVDVNGNVLGSDASSNNIMHDLGNGGANSQTMKEIINAPTNIRSCNSGVTPASGGCN